MYPELVKGNAVKLVVHTSEVGCSSEVLQVEGHGCVGSSCFSDFIFLDRIRFQDFGAALCIVDYMLGSTMQYVLSAAKRAPSSDSPTSAPQFQKGAGALVAAMAFCSASSAALPSLRMAAQAALIAGLAEPAAIRRAGRSGEARRMGCPARSEVRSAAELLAAQSRQANA